MSQSNMKLLSKRLKTFNDLRPEILAGNLPMSWLLLNIRVSKFDNINFNIKIKKFYIYIKNENFHAFQI